MHPLVVFGLFTLSFTIGLSGALSPGPLLVVTVYSSLRRGLRGGLLTVSGHLLIEAPLIVALAYGASSVLTNETVKLVIMLIGGCMLFLLGSYTILSAKRMDLTKVLPPLATNASAENRVSLHPTLSGIIATASNPFFWVWWATIGLAMMTYAPLIVMANLNPILYWSSLKVLFDAARSLLENLPTPVHLFVFLHNLSYVFSQMVDFNYFFVGSTLIGWVIIALGHFSSDIAWYTSVSVVAAKSVRFLSTKLYQKITLLCGLSLLLFGLLFLTSSFLF
ncbi:MAG: LysE family transporter [Candidatus Jordarchaeales archaeon]